MQGSPIQFEFEDISPVEKRLKVEVAREQVNQKLEEAYRKAAREVNLPGFRKGKVPREMLQKLFGKRIEADVANQLIHDSIMYIANRGDVSMAATPIVDAVPELRRDQALRYTAKIEMFPTFKDIQFDGLEVNRRAPQITDEHVELFLQQRRRQHVEMLPIEGRDTAAPTDVLTLTVSGQIGHKHVDNEVMELDLTEPALAPIPGLPEALIGLSLSAADHPVTVTLPTEGVPADLSGTQLHLRVTVKAAHLKRLPELDDDFAKDTGEAETIQELRDKIRADLAKQDQEEADRDLRQGLVEALLQKNPVPLPPSAIQRYADAYFEQGLRHERMMAAGRGDPTPIDQAELRQRLHAEAVRGMSANLLLSALADQQHIEITEAEVEKRLAEMARRQDKSVARLKAEMQKDDPQLKELHHQLRQEKTLDLVESRAHIKEPKEPGPR